MRSLLINATMTSEVRLTGLGVYTVHVLERLLPRLRGESPFDQIVLIGDRDRLNTLLGTDLMGSAAVCECSTTSPLRRVLKLNRIVRRMRREGEVTFYSPTHHGVVCRGVDQVITIHDLFARLFPGNYPAQYYYFRLYLPHVLRRSRCVVTDSDSTAKDLRRFYPSASPSRTIHLAPRNDIAGQELQPIPDLQDTPFFLFVGPSYTYKNCVRLIDAFALFRVSQPGRLVFVGGRRQYVDVLKHHLERHLPTLKRSVVFLEYASPGQLRWLYRTATATMITTLCEGFGLPALEAMQEGCPVVASKAGALPEVCGEAALYIDPFSTEATAEAMTRLAREPETRSLLIRTGIENLRRFDWARTADQVLDVITGRSK